MFVGRERELEQLRNFLNRASPGIAVIYGRRRIGKTQLIAQVLKGRNALFFDGLENQAQHEQIDNFLFQAAHQGITTGPSQERSLKWREALYLLHESVKKRPCVIVLDEFQWMANYRREMVADLKLVWDRYLSKVPGVFMILCGSIASFMVERVVRSTALYGRAELVIHLRPFELRESAAILCGRGWKEVLEAQMLVGGVPQYLELLAESPSVRLGIEQLAFTETGYFVEEFQRIFVSHFGRNKDFEAIVRALAHHSHGLYRPELTKEAKVEQGGTLSKHLRDLESAGFISSLRPVDKRPNTRLIKYFLADAYLRFYLAFIAPSLARIQSTADGRIFERLTQSGAFHSWMGLSFEHVCRDHASHISRILGFSGIDFKCGPYLRPKRGDEPGVQVDLLFDRADRVVTVCEMKYQQSPVGSGVIAEVQDRVDHVRRSYPGRTVQTVLVTANGVTRDVAASLFFYRTLTADELFGG